MAQKILLAFDSSENAMRAVEFVARSFPTEDSITLFHVFSDSAVLCDMHSPELAEYFIAQQSSFCALEDKKKDLVKQKHYWWRPDFLRRRSNSSLKPNEKVSPGIF